MNPTSPETVIAVMQKDLEYIKQGISKIEQSMKEMGCVFVTSKEFSEHKTLVSELEKKTATIERNMLMAIGGLSVIVFILKFFI